METEKATGRHRRIVVGTDGSPSSVGAVRWALEAACLVDAWLDVVLVWAPDIDFGWLGAPPVHGWLPDPAIEGRALVEAVVDRVCTGRPAETVRTFVIEGDPAQSLLAHSSGANLLVVGDRGTGGFLGLRLGSVASACARRATCPLLVVPEGGSAPQRIPPRRAGTGVGSFPASPTGVPL